MGNWQEAIGYREGQRSLAEQSYLAMTMYVVLYEKCILLSKKACGQRAQEHLLSHCQLPMAYCPLNLLYFYLYLFWNCLL
ncbi:MAG: hypothetical protein H6Q53_651 [Deltaproteobacteria bacterium]|nr:hypothetical protein [Deltaproteobacteria bacterium]